MSTDAQEKVRFARDSPLEVFGETLGRSNLIEMSFRGAIVAEL
jgi:hypothetical protein